MSLSDLEKEILAEGEKLTALAKKGALEARKLFHSEELKKIEKELSALVTAVETVVEEVVKPIKKAAAKAAAKSKEEAAEDDTSTDLDKS